MKKTWIITLGREFCSGGLDVAKELSLRLGVPYYDRDLIDRAVELTNLSREEVAANEERGESVRRGFLYGRKWYSNDPELMLPVHMRIYQAQCEAIRRLAGEGSCIFVGRCADFVLGECDQVVNVLNVFVRAGMDFRAARAVENYALSDSEARKLIARTDKIRARYYNGHTGREWGSAGNYNLVVDTSVLGIAGAAAVIEAAVKQL
ncbi:MAG: cytidylate kinase-like family protein [Clostridia bacterium]|nr:cytidylate kinase-like family protein [Clostridia bacterium]